jgi:hypothetical protein
MPKNASSRVHQLVGAESTAVRGEGRLTLSASVPDALWEC